MKGAIIIEGHVQGLANTRNLGKQNIPVFVLDAGRKCLAQHSKYCTRFFQCPPYHSDELADFMMNLADKEQIRDWLILPSNDHAVMTLSRHKEQLSEFFRIISPDLPVAEIIYDKRRLVELAAGAGVAVPLTWGYHEPPPDIATFPVLVRGKHGLSFYRVTGRKAFLCEDPASLNKLLSIGPVRDLADRILIQEMIPDHGDNPTISAGLFCVNGTMKACWMGAKLREHPVRFGTATLAESLYIPELTEDCRKLAQALQYDGICEIEFLYDPRDGKYKLIEINPRTWLWIDLARACGIDLVTMAWNHTYGHPVHYPANYTTGLKWRNFHTDLYFSMQALLTGQLPLRHFLRQNHGRKIPAVWDRKDPRPFFYMNLMLPYLIRNR